MSEEGSKIETQDPPEPGTLVLKIILHQGRNLKKTVFEKLQSLLMDNVMDPYIRFEVTHPSKATNYNCAPVRQSSTKDNDENPVWEEKFSFFVDESEPGQLQMTLWDANLVLDSQMSDFISIDLDSLPVGGDYQRRTVTIHHATGEIEISLCMQRTDTGYTCDMDRTKQSSLDKELYPHEYIQRVDVIVHEGHNLKKSLYLKLSQLMLDLLMDPYVQVKVTKPWEKVADSAVQNTTCKYDTENPVWEERLSFLLDTREGPGQLHLTIWDSNYVMDSKLTSTVVIELNEINVGWEYKRRCLGVYGGGGLEISLRRRIPTADVRYGCEVHKKEEEIVKTRRENAAAAIMASLGAGKKVEKVPTVNVVASGGGIRAMVATSGAIRALHDAGLLDWCTYMSTLSGSTWYLSVLYLLEKSPNVDKCTAYLKQRCSVMGPLMHYSRMADHLGVIEKKYFDGHNVSLVDIWAAMIGQVLQTQLEKRDRTRLSDAQKSVATCQLPFPIYTALFVKKRTATDVFAEWMEFTPFEYGIRNFELFTAIEHIGSDVNHGIVCRLCQEFRVHFMQGLWGSAFAGAIRKWVQALLSKRPMMRKCINKILAWTGLNDLRPLAAMLPNYMKGISSVPESTRCIGCSMEELFSDHLPPGDCLSLDYQANQESDGERQELLDEDECQELPCAKRQKIHRAGPIPETQLHEADGVDEPDGLPSPDILQEDGLTVVDAGLDFNLPFPPLLRPERHTDIFLAFDYTWYGSQTTDPFRELRKAKQWADESGYKLPPIPDGIFDPRHPKEYYILEDAEDPECPIVIFFCLCNVKRYHDNIPGQNDTFAKVKPFASVYSTFNFNYTADDFERLHELCYYNTKLAVEDIKKTIAKKLK